MPTSWREVAIAAVVDTLNAASLTAQTVERNLETAFTIADLPAVVVIEGGHEVVRQETYAETYELTFFIELYVTGANVGTKLNALYLEVINALVGDRTLGGGVNTVTEQAMSDPEIERDDMGAQVMTATLQMVAEVETSDTNKSI